MTEEDRTSIQAIDKKRVSVMPTLRWQVFQRDDWKGVSCGRKAVDGSILHSDNISPVPAVAKIHWKPIKLSVISATLGKAMKIQPIYEPKREVEQDHPYLETSTNAWYFSETSALVNRLVRPSTVVASALNSHGEEIGLEHRIFGLVNQTYGLPPKSLI